MLLKDKVAVIYGAGGAIGGAAARSLVREGAKVFLSGRNIAPVKRLRRTLLSQWAERLRRQGMRSTKTRLNNTLPM